MKEQKKKEAPSDKEEEDEVIWLSNDSETEEDEGDENDEDYIPTPMKKKRSSGVRSKPKEDTTTPAADVAIVPADIRSHVETLKVKELKEALKAVGLAISGRKDELKARLLSELARRVNMDKTYKCSEVFAEMGDEVLPITIKSLPLHNKRDSVVQKKKEAERPPRSSFEPIYPTDSKQNPKPSKVRPGSGTENAARLSNQKNGVEPPVKDTNKRSSNPVSLLETESGLSAQEYQS